MSRDRIGAQAALAQRAASLDAEIRQRKESRPGAAEQAIALATGNRVGAMVENEAMFQLLTAERDQVMRLLDAFARLGTAPVAARATFDTADADYQQKHSQSTHINTYTISFISINHNWTINSISCPSVIN